MGAKLSDHSDPLELELVVVMSYLDGIWEPNTGPLEEQQ